MRNSDDIFKYLSTQIVALWDKENPLIHPPMHNSEDIFKKYFYTNCSIAGQGESLDTASNA